MPRAGRPTGSSNRPGGDRSSGAGARERPARADQRARTERPTRAQTGRLGEDLAAGWAAAQGWQVVDRNWRHGRAGELDLVALDGDGLVAVEVKTRRGDAYGHPAEAVTPAKVARLRRLTAAWLDAHELHPATVRVDVLAVTLHPHGGHRVEHLRAVD